MRNKDYGKSKNIWVVMIVMLTTCYPADSALIQAVIDLDDTSEDLIELLIDKVDKIIDPKNDDFKNATRELAYALLKIGPLLTINGNISDGNNAIALNFNLNAKAAVSSLTDIDLFSGASEEEFIHQLKKSQGGVLEPIVNVVEPLVLELLHLILQSILSIVIAQVMQEVTLIGDIDIA